MNYDNNRYILVTGGAGFIGSYIVDGLLEMNYNVKVIDNLSTGNKMNLRNAMQYDNFKFVYGSIVDTELLRREMKDVCMVCHQAALGSVPRSIEDPFSSHQTNVNGFFNILNIMKDYGIKRIVYASSSSVYGDSDILPKKEENKVSVKFLLVDVTGNAAVAKFEFYVGQKLTFVDYQFLYKFQENWKIVSKIYYKF